ncbi:MAG: hypothetical protein ACI957_004587, partial [Verrucomicrobiales bacterium]
MKKAEPRIEPSPDEALEFVSRIGIVPPDDRET